MRISGNKPSSVILNQTKWFQNLKMIARKYQKGAETNISKLQLQNYNLIKHGHNLTCVISLCFISRETI